MTSSDLDPVFVKALKLLQSRSKDSYFQLRQMYDDVVAQRKAECVIKREIDGSVKSGNGNGHSATDTAKKKELDTSNLEKLKQDLADLSQDVTAAKKIKLESGTSASVSSSSSPRAEREKERDRGSSDKTKASESVVKEKPRERLREIEEDIFFGPSASSSSRAKDRERQEREEREKQASRLREKKEVAVMPTVIDSGSDTEVSDDASQDETGQMDQMQFDLDIGNLSCVICNTMSISSTNRLVECQECHSLYHQDCHKPPVTEDVNDPRFVWYCCKCAKNLKKIVVKQKKPTKPGPATSARDSPVSKPMKADPPQMLQPFKRPEAIKPTVVKESSEAGRGLVGLASLAKNLNSRSSTSASSSTGSADVSRSKSDQSSGNNQPALTKPSGTETKSSASASWGSGGAFSAARPTALGKTDPPSSQKSGKTTSVVPGLVKSSPSPATGSGTVVTSSTVKMSQSTLMSADKRLQNMKKKAKMAEKRPR